MSVLSLSYQLTNICQSLPDIMAGKQLAWRNYVTVTLCICRLMSRASRWFDRVLRSVWPPLFCSLAVLDPTVGHTMDVLCPFISIRCNSDWLFHRESCSRFDVVYPGRAWSSSPACTWHCSLQHTINEYIYFFLQAISGFAAARRCLRFLVSSWYDHIVLASSLWQCLTVPSLLQVCWEPTHLFSLLSTKHAESFSAVHLKGTRG